MTQKRSFHENDSSAEKNSRPGKRSIWTRRRVIQASGVGLVGLAVTPLLANGLRAWAAQGSAGPLPWPEANAILSETAVPVFPNHTFLLTSYGGKGDGSTDNTTAFQKAIAACNAAGGGHVVVPTGTYVTGAIRLLSNVDLHLNTGVVLMFSGNTSTYPLVLTRYEGIECINHSPMIYAYGQTNIALTGSGILDASHTASWNKGSNRAGVLDPMVAAGVPPDKRNVAGKLRSTFVEPYNCDTVLIQGVTLRNSRFWQLHPTLCKNVTVDGTTTNVAGANTDGCDPECCDHVVIKNSTLKAGDDNIAIKSGRDADGRRVNTPCQNIVIWNNVFEGPWGAITLGSELTGGIQNVYAYANSTTGSGTRFVHYVKSNTLRGGFARNVNIDTFHGSNLHTAVVFITMTYSGQTGHFPPDFSGPFSLNNLVVNKAPIVLDLEGLSGDKIGPVSLSNSTFTNITHATSTISNVSKVTYANVTINGKPV